MLTPRGQRPRRKGEAAAQRDPDAYVALLLAAFEDAKREDPQTLQDDTATSATSDFDYWLQLDLDAVYRNVGAFFADIHNEKGVSQQYYPGWLVRRHIAMRVIEAAASISPDAFAGGETLFAAARDSENFFFTEDARLDEELELYLARQHLTQLVDAVVQALSAE